MQCTRFITLHILVFSSPDHEVVRSELLGSVGSGVRRPSSVVHTWGVYSLEVTVLNWSSLNLVRMFVSMISRPSSILGHVGSKMRSIGQIKENFKKPLVYTLEVTFMIQSSWNLVTMFVLMMSRSSLILGHFGSKMRSVGQIKEKFCLH